MVKVVCEHGGDLPINKPDEDNVTPLYLAIYMQKPTVVRYLLEHGAAESLHIEGQFRYTYYVQLQAKHTPLDFACLIKECFYTNIKVRCPLKEHEHYYSSKEIDEIIEILRYWLNKGQQTSITNSAYKTAS